MILSMIMVLDISDITINFVHLQSPLEDLLGLGAPDGAVDGDLLVPPDAEAPDGEPGLGEDGRLTGQLLQNLGRSRQSIAGFAHANIEAQLADGHVPHHVLGLLLGRHPDALKRKRKLKIKGFDIKSHSHTYIVPEQK